MKSNLILLSILCVSLFSCVKKDDPIDANASSNAKVTFSNFVGSQPLTLQTKWYNNANGDSFKVNVYKYYITNVKLIKSDNSVYTENESYHLINEADASSHSFVMANVPEGSYTSISFLIGVDSARNTSGAQTGALDPINGMFWTWNSGYIMAKFEGVSPQSTSMDKSVVYHLGGFSGPNNVLRTVTLSFPTTMIVKKGTTPNVHIDGDLAEWFSFPNVIDFAQKPLLMTPGKDLVNIAENYKDMFKVNHID
jgi:hypothetical protein